MDDQKAINEFVIEAGENLARPDQKLMRLEQRPQFPQFNARPGDANGNVKSQSLNLITTESLAGVPPRYLQPARPVKSHDEGRF